MDFIVSGPSGAGKTSLIEKVLESDDRIQLSMSYTTRPRHNGEVDGEDYNFTDPTTFMDMAARGQFLEWAEVHGYLYGTPRRVRSSTLDVIYDVNCEGARNIKAQVRDAVSILILPPSPNELRRRLNERRRGESDEQNTLRLRMATDELQQASMFDCWIRNDDFEEAASMLMLLISLKRRGLPLLRRFRDPVVLGTAHAEFGVGAL